MNYCSVCQNPTSTLFAKFSTQNKKTTFGNTERQNSSPADLFMRVAGDQFGVKLTYAYTDDASKKPFYTCGSQYCQSILEQSSNISST